MTTDRESTVGRSAVVLGGRRVSYLHAGPPDGAPVVLIHGLLSDSTTWARVLPGLAHHGLRLVAPDLLGHGESDKPADATYRLEEFAGTVNLLMSELGITRATLAGHSLGGGTAMAVSYLHPERVARLVLVASGGFGTDLHPVLRGATLPGAQALVRLAATTPVRRVLAQGRLHRSLRLRPESISNLARMGRGIRSDEGRAAFYATLNQAIDANGQRGSMVEMGYVNPDIPTLLVWSERDPIIPVSHAHVADAFLARSRLELFPGVSHEPHRRHADHFVDVLADFLADPVA